MRAHELIFENSDPQDAFRSQKKTWQDLEQALPRIQTAIERFHKGARIFRGLKFVKHPVLFKPQMPKGTRSSANTENFYTLFMDNDIQWKYYPPRSASVIAATDFLTAYYNGYPFIVLPEGNPIIGLANESDIWESFPRVKQLPYLKNLHNLNLTISGIINRWLSIDNYKPSSWQEFKQILQRIDQINYLSFPNLPKNLPNRNILLYPAEQQLLQLHPGTIMEEKLEYLLDPAANQFKLTKLSSLKIPEHELEQHELWFSAPCWLICFDDISYMRSNNITLVELIKQKAAEERR